MLGIVHSACRVLGCLAIAAVAALPANAEDAPGSAPGRSGVSPPEEHRGLPPARTEAGVEAPIGEPAARHNASLATPGKAGISIGPQALAQGDPRYAQRNDVAGTALVVSFASSPPPEPARFGTQPFLMPVAGRLTGAFGWRSDPLRGSARFHAGIDLAAPAGSPVRAASDGSVASAGWSGGYGYMVVLDHGNGIETRYAHMSHIAVEVGRSVRQGEIVGLVGSTGRSTGSHVHYEVRVAGRATDPMRR